MAVARENDPAQSPRLPAARRRRQLLDVALARFAAGGFHATSMEDIADAAGVSKPVLYQHFRSKRALYLELLEDVGAALLDTIAHATAAVEDPKARVQRGFAAYFRFVAARREAFELLFGSGARRDAEFDAAVRRVEDTIAATVASLIDVDLDADHRHLLAYGVVGMAEGAGRWWLDTAARSSPESAAKEADRIARRMADLAWAGLRAVRRD
jgi:AcrR family transcriptional regulator